jgi:hypothetical protein
MTPPSNLSSRSTPDSSTYSPRSDSASLTNGIMNWDQFCESIDQNINLKTPNDIDDAVQKFTEIIQTAAWKSLLMPPKCQANSLTVPTHIRELITQKRHARARWQHTRLPSDKSIYNNLTSSLKRILNKLRNDSFNEWISSLTTKDGSLWRATRICLKQRSPQSPLKNINGNWCKSDLGKAKTFRSHLSDVFQPHQNIDNQNFSNHIESSLTSYILHLTAHFRYTLPLNHSLQVKSNTL